MSRLVYLNGQFVDHENAKVHVYDHGFLYGDASNDRWIWQLCFVSLWRYQPLPCAYCKRAISSAINHVLLGEKYVANPRTN